MMLTILRGKHKQLLSGILLFGIVWIIFNVEFRCSDRNSPNHAILGMRAHTDCHQSRQGTGPRIFDPSMPVIYAITPTYARLQQKAELTRLSQTLLHLPNFHWILVEDAPKKTKLVTDLLRSSGLSYTHLSALTPEDVKLRPREPHYLKPRGVSQRNEGLSWIRRHLDSDKNHGVVYFADDDNTYDLRIFAEMRRTKRVSVWPVGFTGGLRYAGPVVKQGKVTGWFTGWAPERPFAIDMAGFAINLKLFFQYPDARFSNYVKKGYQESTILLAVNTTLDVLEPLAENCTKVRVWHTRADYPILDGERKFKLKQHKHSFSVLDNYVGGQAH